MNDFFASVPCFGLFLTLGSFQLARSINSRLSKPRLNPLLFSTIVCIAVLLLGHIDYDTYYVSAGNLDFLLTPATICLAIPLYKQYTLLKKNTAAVAAGCVAGVAVHMAFTVLLLVIFSLDAPGFATLLPKSITTAIGKGLSQELGGYPAVTMATIMLTGIFGAVAAPKLLKLMGVREPLAQGLAIGTSAHAAGTSRAVEMGEVQGAASSLAIVVTGLLTVVSAPLVNGLFPILAG